MDPAVPLPGGLVPTAEAAGASEPVSEETPF